MSTVRALLDLDGFCNLGIADDAIKAFERLPDEIRNDAEVLTQFTAFLWRMGRLKECFVFAILATEKHPALSLFWLIASSCLQAPEAREARRALLLKAAESCPDDAKHLLAMAEEETGGSATEPPL